MRGDVERSGELARGTSARRARRGSAARIRGWERLSYCRLTLVKGRQDGRRWPALRPPCARLAGQGRAPGEPVCRGRRIGRRRFAGAACAAMRARLRPGEVGAQRNLDLLRRACVLREGRQKRADRFFGLRVIDNLAACL